MLKRRNFLASSLALSLAVLSSGCGFTRIDPWHVLIRSDRIKTMAQEREILSRAKLSYSEDGRIRVLHVQGTPYERGYQHGALLRAEVRDNLTYFYERALKTFYFEELFVESFERQRPYISEEYMEEMHGLAHGSGLPLKMIHHIHILPSISEWGGKRRIKKLIKGMMAGSDLDDLATSCSNFSVTEGASSNNAMYTVRILDWGLHRISKLHQYPLILVAKPNDGVAYANIGWVGFLGAISGMNAQGITLGEMGYKDPANEDLRGRPMAFMLRDVLSQASSLNQARNIISSAPGENSYLFLISDGKTQQAELYVKDRERFLAFKAGEELKDQIIDGDKIKEEYCPAIKNTVYGGHYNEIMHKELSENYGKITPEMIMQEMIPKMAMKSNFQNVLYDPVNLRFWVSNAMNAKARAAEQPYTFFDLKEALAK